LAPKSLEDYSIGIFYAKIKITKNRTPKREKRKQQFRRNPLKMFLELSFIWERIFYISMKNVWLCL